MSAAITRVEKVPGKVILFGEHAVVYGHPALATTVDLKTEITLQLHKRSSAENGAHLVVHAPILGLTAHRWSADDGQLTPAQSLLYRAVLSLWPDGLPQAYRIEFILGGSLPIGKGMGSSAALSVALLRLQDGLFGCQDPRPLYQRAHALECIFHGNPSGVDAAVISHGGALSFRKGPPLQLETIEIRRALPMVVIDSGTEGSTREMVDGVARRRAADPRGINRLFEDIAGCVHHGKGALASGDFQALGQIMDQNHHLLQRLGVSTPKLDELAALSRKNGALGAKLSGAGGGGILLALCNDAAHGKKLAQEIRALGFQAWTTQVGI